MSILILYPHRFSQELKRIQKGCGRLSMTSSGRLTLLSLKNTEGFRTFSLKSAREVFGLKWPKQPDTAWHSLTHLKFSYFLVSKSESRGNFLRGGQGRSQEEMAPCQSCHTAGELFAEVGTISRLGNPFVFFSMDNNHNRHNQQKIIFFVYYQRLALTIFSCDRGQCLA